MGKVLKWFFGIIVMILIVGVILMFCGILKFKYSSPIPGIHSKKRSKKRKQKKASITQTFSQLWAK